MNVEKILNRKGSHAVETIAAETSVAEAAAALGQKKIGALIVSGSGKTVDGIVSERDIVKLLGQTGAAALDSKVADIMTRDVVCCQPHETADSVLARMTEGRFRHMPVMEGGEMVGLLSIGDVVKARMDEIERENQAMQEMLSH